MSVAGDRAAGLVGYLAYDEEDGNLREQLIRAKLDPFERLSLIAHGDGETIGPLQAVTDPAVAPLWALPYAGQWTGGQMPPRLAGESDEDYTARARAEMLSPRSLRRGSPESYAVIAQAYLTGTQAVQIVEFLYDSVWELGVIVDTDEVTDLPALEAALNHDDVVFAGGKVHVLEVADIPTSPIWDDVPPDITWDDIDEGVTWDNVTTTDVEAT